MAGKASEPDESEEIEFLLEKLWLSLQGEEDISWAADVLNKLAESPDYLENFQYIEALFKLLASAFEQDERFNSYGTLRVKLLRRKPYNRPPPSLSFSKRWPEMMLHTTWILRIYKAPKGQYESVMTQAMEATGLSRSTLAARVKEVKILPVFNYRESKVLPE